jgi:hypothetical protein
MRAQATRLEFHLRPQAGKGRVTGTSPLNRNQPAQMVYRFSHRGAPRGVEVAVKGEVLQGGWGFIEVIFYGLKEI